MAKRFILSYIKGLNRPVFTTQEIAALSKKSVSNVTQSLNILREQGIIIKVYRGIWAEVKDGYLSPYSVAPFLIPGHRVYISFISALHLYGIIEQIPQVVTAATTVHSKKIRTGISTFLFHKISPEFFKGFNWYKGSGSFLIAEPEKALIDCLYLSTRKKQQYAYFPELHFSSSFSFKKAEGWVKGIPDIKIRSHVEEALKKIK